MQITHHTAERLTVEQKNMLMQILPWAIGGAGLLLTLGMIDEYGVQSWYRTPYWLGAVVASLGLFFAVTFPSHHKVVLNRPANRVTVQAKRGIRVVYYEQYPLDTVQELRIEEGQKAGRDGNPLTRYRLAISVLDQWVPMLPLWQEDLEEHQRVAGYVQAFLDHAPKSS
jgi:hypothetical protein